MQINFLRLSFQVSNFILASFFLTGQIEAAERRLPFQGYSYLEDGNMIHGGPARCIEPVKSIAAKKSKPSRRSARRNPDASIGINQEMRMETEWGPRSGVRKTGADNRGPGPGDINAFAEPLIEDYRGNKIHFIPGVSGKPAKLEQN